MSRPEISTSIDTKTTTRHSIGISASCISLKDENHFEFDLLRSSHRRSSKAKIIVPRLSVADFQSHSHGGHVIKFDVEKEGGGVKGPKETLSSLLRDTQLTRQSIKQDLELKARARVSEENPLSAEQSQVDPDLCVPFTGEMRQQHSSKFTETELSMEAEAWKKPWSASVMIEDISYISLEDIWPWPWLPSNLSSSEYISMSKTPVTFSMQEKLPDFPLMPLHQLLRTFLRSVRLFLRPDRLAQVAKLLDTFLKNSGKKYQNLVRESPTELLSDNMISSLILLPCLVPSVEGCLTRLEAPLANTGIIAPFTWDLWPARLNSQLDRAVILIQVLAEFARLLYSERLSLFYDECGHPQCNHQFRKLFSSAKIPGSPYDGTHCFFKTMYQQNCYESPKHIIVICRGQLFCLDIVLAEFNTLSTVELTMSLQQIQKIAEENVRSGKEEVSIGVGILSSMDRDVWSDTRKHLMELSDNNRASLQMLEEAMFVLSLDHVNARAPDRLANEALFADGFNRWYDKGLSFYMYQNGLLTVNVCSSIVDTSIVNSLLRFIHLRILEDSERWEDEVYMKSGLLSRCVSAEVLSRTRTLSKISGLVSNSESGDSELDFAGATTSSKTDHLSALDFDLDDSLKNIIGDAKISFLQLSENISSSVCEFVGFEMNFFRDRKINVDAVAHLTMQLTFFKMYFRPAAVGSKVSIRRFRHAQYDTQTTTTEQSIAWCRAMLTEDVPASEKKRLFYSAVEKHVQILEEARSGLGCFNNFSALRETALAKDDHMSVKVLDDLAELPAGGLESMDINCEGLNSLGCLSVPVVVPQTTSSYGVGYAMAKAKALFTVCSWKINPGTCAEMFARSLYTCLEEVQCFALQM